MPDSQIDEIKSKIDVVDFLSEYIQLKKTGANYRALCPFHNEKTPSFMVSQEKQIWHCFGCGEGGDIFGFLMRYENMEFIDALRTLAERAGVQLRQTDPADRNQKSRILDILKASSFYFLKNLVEHPEAKAARNYIKSERRLTDEIISKFKIGYSLDNWRALINTLEGKGYSPQEIFLAGMSVRKEDGSGYYDRFRGRVMFPVHDIHGNVTGFSARILSPGDQAAKYINTPQTLVYNKSKSLYGIYQAKAEIKERGFSLIVEGNMDVLACFKHGINNAVASSGTALTPDQIAALKRYSTQAVISFDADAAGLEAMKRGVELMLESGMSVKITQLPRDGQGSFLYKDPDECLKSDPLAFKKAVKDSRLFMDYLFESARNQYDLKRVDGKKSAAKEILRFLSQIADPVEKNHYLQQLSSLINVEEGILREALPGKTPKRGESALPKEGRSQKKDRNQKLAENYLAILIRNPDNIDYAIGHLLPEHLRHDPSSELYKEMIIYYTEKKLDSENFSEKLTKLVKADKRLVDFITVLELLYDNEFSDFEESDISSEIVRIIIEIKKNYYLVKSREIEAEIAKAEQAGDARKIQDLTQQFKEITDEFIKLN